MRLTLLSGPPLRGAAFALAGDVVRGDAPPEPPVRAMMLGGPWPPSPMARFPGWGTPATRLVHLRTRPNQARSDCSGGCSRPGGTGAGFAGRYGRGGRRRGGTWPARGRRSRAGSNRLTYVGPRLI